MTIQDFAKKYESIGRCIYCSGLEKLTDEHIIPFGLGGPTYLPKASCDDCAKITQRFEQAVLRGPMWDARVVRKLKTRRPREAPTTETLVVVRGGIEETVQLPLEQYPVLLHFPLFKAPAFTSGEPYEKGISLDGIDTIGFGPSPEETARRLGASRIKITQDYIPVEFAKMIAKIAYSYSVGELGFVSPENVYVVPVIRGEIDDIGRWVGVTNRDVQPPGGPLHYLRLLEDRHRRLLLGEVRLFADSQTPTYVIVIRSLQG